MLERTLAANQAAGLPEIDVSPAQGRMLTLLAEIAGARRILEVGTLGGYSTICLARALPADGRLVTLEIDPHHAQVARDNIAAAGFGERVDDLVFIDADKAGNPGYLRAALALSRPGTVIICDNVVRDGRVADAASDDPGVLGTRRMFEQVAAEPRLRATAIQTVGAKGWDGFMIALVGAEP